MPFKLVRELVSRKFGKEIKTHYDVVQLQEAIIQQTGKRISTQTIKRFFGLIKSNSKPDPATLDAIAGFLHFSSFNDLVKWQTLRQNPEVNQREFEWASELVLQIVKDIKPENLHEPGLLQLVKNLFILFERHPQLPSVIYPRLAASEFGRRFFFEQFIHYDALAYHYGVGLEHFLIHEDSKPHRAFAYCMLMLRSFLTSNHEIARYCFAKLSVYTLQEVDSYHPFLIGRYYGAKVLMNAMEGVNSVAYVEEQIKLLLSTERNATDLYHGYPCAEMVFAESLILTGHFQQAYDLLNHRRIKEYNHPPYMDISFKTHLNLVRLLGGIYAGTITADKAKKEIELLQKSPVYFLAINYIQLLIHLVKMKLDIQPKQSRAKVDGYLATLGFTLPAAFRF